MRDSLSADWSREVKYLNRYGNKQNIMLSWLRGYSGHKLKPINVAWGSNSATSYWNYAISLDNLVRMAPRILSDMEKKYGKGSEQLGIAKKYNNRNKKLVQYLYKQHQNKWSSRK